MELLETAAQEAQTHLESQAKTLAYYEASRASMADAINRAALRTDQDDSPS
ncbi:hypothetical protein BTZ20_4481 [Rhodococcus sp. MTM3W5.2]|nr:hypothetical protein BTZ20_4481 [Rhodococcus sp. MTM3W5.2]